MEAIRSANALAEESESILLLNGSVSEIDSERAKASAVGSLSDSNWQSIQELVKNRGRSSISQACGFHLYKPSCNSKRLNATK